jgi:hypothetical protein
VAAGAVLAPAGATIASIAAAMTDIAAARPARADRGALPRPRRGSSLIGTVIPEDRVVLRARRQPPQVAVRGV